MEGNLKNFSDVKGIRGRLEKFRGFFSNERKI